MIRRVACASALYALMFTAIPAMAAGDMRPGLWEMTTQSAMTKNLPRISPGQLEQLKNMGVDISQLQNGAVVGRVCITKEMAEREELPPLNEKEAGCEITKQSRSGATYLVDMQCDNAQMTGRGTSKTVFANSRSFSSTADFTGSVQGLPVQDRIDTSGKWVSDDCGSVKPLTDQTPAR